MYWLSVALSNIQYLNIAPRKRSVSNTVRLTLKTGAVGAWTSISRRTAYRKSFAAGTERHAFVQKRQHSEYPPEARARR
jgi:hypothetical protein